MNRPKLVIIPGWSNDSSGRLWHYQRQYLQEQYDVEFIVVTNRTTVKEAAEEVLCRAPEQFVLLGHSLGGLIAQHVAIQVPQRVQNLILVGTFPGRISSEQRTFFETGILQPLLNGTICWEELNKACVSPARIEDRILLESLRAGQGLSNDELIQQTKILLSAQDICKELPAVSAPTLIIYGRDDQLFSMETQKLMLDHLPNAKLVIIEDCGHLPSLEQPQAVTSLLSLWLQMTAPI